MDDRSIAVAIPCYNESVTISKVVTDFKHELPNARITVFDNNSTDGSIEKARAAGAEIFSEKRQGKGFVVRKIFETLHEDIVILVDGDDTYFAADVHELLRLLKENDVDMAVGNRLVEIGKGMNGAHTFGNHIIKRFLNFFFGTDFKDILSGYRAFSKSFYKNIPLMSGGFEIETELVLQAVERGYSIKEVQVGYKDRPSGSYSKIKDFSDGYKIIFTIISLLRDYRPMVFFSWMGGAFIFFGLLSGLRVVVEFVETGLVLYMPTAVLSVSLIIIGINAFLSGLTVSAINRRTREMEMIMNKKK
ncbi:MAG TPA: glycosyltransferase [Patescibacteria group bacterium]